MVENLPEDDVYMGGYDALDMNLEDESGGDEYCALDEEEEEEGDQGYDGECSFAPGGVSGLPSLCANHAGQKFSVQGQMIASYFEYEKPYQL